MDRRQSSGPNERKRSGSNVAMYRRGSNISEASVFAEVDMAQNEMFSGPISESVPTSTTGFAHRRSRAESITSFMFHEEHQESGSFGDAEVAVEEEPISSPNAENFDEQWDAPDELEAGQSQHPPSPRRKPSMLSNFSRKSRTSQTRHDSADNPLLRRYDTSGSDVSNFSGKGWKDRVSQKIYIHSEDLTIVVAGFDTSRVGLAIYILLCIATGGVAYLLCRWFPSWRIRLIGSIQSLRRCTWVVIEDQWAGMSIQNIATNEYGEALSTVFTSPSKRLANDYMEEDDYVIGHLRILDYRYIRFCFHPLKDKFIVSNSWKDATWSDPEAARKGISSGRRETREQVFGKNSLDIQQKSIGEMLVDEAFHPFYIFQLASLILWSLDEYYYYAACIFLISVTSIATTLFETKATMRRLREISKFECDIRVLRNGFWRYVESPELVPGDVFEITDPSLSQLPCDGLLLTGDAVVNESMLTGESVPVSKTPMTSDSLDLLDLSASSVHPDVAKHMLFSGTRVIRARRPQEGKDEEAAALALVVRTGFNTTKGALVRSMLFPKPTGFKFYQDSFRYIAVMAAIALCGFTASFVNFIELGLSWHLIFVRALDLITIVVPPALPATLTIGTNFAISRLKRNQIFCISPQRVNVGGKIDVMCFDKTGTLTEEGLDVLGIRAVLRPGDRFSDILSNVNSAFPGSSYERDPTIDYSVHQALVHTMATCHSLRQVGRELVGDPLDLKMFSFTTWSFEEAAQQINLADDEERNKLSPSVARPPPGSRFEAGLDETSQTPVELGVLKQFEFSSQLRRASVIVTQFGANSGEVYLKGAPETMRDVCRPETFPIDYEELLSHYTHRGFRVIGCATKNMPKMNWVKVQKMSRQDAESNLTFLGFIIFENKLKPSTPGIIRELSLASVQKVMCTGDNILTAISVARECGLVDSSAHCFVPHFADGDARNPLSRLRWESVDNPNFELDERTLMPLAPPADSDASLPYEVSSLRKYTMAVNGDAFRWIVDYAPDQVLRRMLVSCQVYARMSPDEKHELVEKLQSIEYTVGFCGDGANDCGALKAADVGISLSEAEASVAAPFTSRIFDISCVPQIIREGRASLVTSFSCFKYMSLYSAIQFTTVSFLYASASNLGDFQFLFIDLLLILPIAIFMGWTGPYPYLSPKRPTASLVSRKVLTPLLGQIAICVLVQAVAFWMVQLQPWYLPPLLNRKKSNIANSQNTALFLVSCFQYILSAIVLSVGRPFRQSMGQNLPFVVTIVVSVLISSYILFDPSRWLYNMMQLTPMPEKFKVFLLALATGGFLVALGGERELFPKLARLVGRLRIRLLPKKRRRRKQYKEIKDSMHF